MKTKKLLSLALALVMAAGLLPAMSLLARAAEPTDIANAVITIDPEKQPEFFSNGFNASGSTDNPVDVVIDSVTLNGKVLNQGTDYVIKEGGSKSASKRSDMTQKLVIQGIGSYTGTAEAEWQPKKAAATPDWFYFHKWTTTVGDDDFGIGPYAVRDDGEVTAGGLELCTGAGMLGNNWTTATDYAGLSALTGASAQQPRHYLYKLDGNNAKGKYWRVGSYTVSYAAGGSPVEEPWANVGLYDVIFRIDGTNEWVLDDCEVVFENALEVVPAEGRTNINTLTVTIDPFTHTGQPNSLYQNAADREHVHFYTDENCENEINLEYDTDWTVLPSTWVRHASNWVPIYGIGGYYGVVWALMPAELGTVTKEAFTAVSIAAKTHTYDGQPVAVTPQRSNVLYTNSLDGLTVQYAPAGTDADSNGWTADTPINAGVYDVKLTLPEETVSFLAGSLVLEENITIEKAEWTAPEINVTVTAGDTDTNGTVKLPEPPPGLTANVPSNGTYVGNFSFGGDDEDSNKLRYTAYTNNDDGYSETVNVSFTGDDSNYESYVQPVKFTWRDPSYHPGNANGVLQVAVSYKLNGQEVRVLARESNNDYVLDDPIPGAATDIRVAVTPVHDGTTVEFTGENGSAISGSGEKMVAFRVIGEGAGIDYFLTVTVLQSYTVSFDVNGGTGAMDTKKFDGDPDTYQYTLPTRPSDVTAPAGSTFAGYRLKNSTNDTIYHKDDVYTLYADNPDVTFELVWLRDLANAVVTCAPDEQAIADGGDKNVVITSVYWSDGAGTLYELTKDTDYTIESGGTASGTDPQTLTIKGIGDYTGTATATWRLQSADGLKELLVDKKPNKDTYVAGESFDPDGLEVAAVYNNDGSRVLDLADCEIRPDRELAYGDVAVFVSYTKDDVTKTVSVPITVKPGAQTIDFDANGGSVTPASAVTDIDGKLASLPKPTLAGSSFRGWFTAKTGGVEVTTSTVFSKKTIVYARWAANGGGGATQFTLTYETNGGSAVTATKHNNGATVTLTATPTKEGFTFDGWYSDAALTSKITSIKMDGNKTVYAGWKENENPNTGAHDCPSKHLKDVDENAWYHKYVDYVIENGLMYGIADDRFGPDVTTSRAMIVTILYRLEGQPAVTGANPFDDVKDGQWYTNAVIWANQNGIVEGYGDGKFGTDDNITREQFAAILYRYVQTKGGGFTGAWYFPLDFADAADVSDWADEAMHWCVMNGIFEGDENGKLRPQGKATRAEAAAILMRFIENVK